MTVVPKARPPVPGNALPGTRTDAALLKTPGQFIQVAVECAQTIDTIREGTRHLEDGMDTLRGHMVHLGTFSSRLREITGKRRRDGHSAGRLSGLPQLSAEGPGTLPIVPPTSHGHGAIAARQSDGHMPPAGKAELAENCRRPIPAAKAKFPKTWAGPFRAVQWWASSYRDPPEAEGDAFGRSAKRYRA